MESHIYIPISSNPQNYQMLNCLKKKPLKVNLTHPKVQAYDSCLKHCIFSISSSINYNIQNKTPNKFYF